MMKSAFLTFVFSFSLGCFAAEEFGAIGYRLVPGTKTKQPQYQLGSAASFADPREALHYASQRCGYGCTNFVFSNGCAGVGITKSRFGTLKNYGSVAAKQPYQFPFNQKHRARSEVRKQLQNQARLQRSDLIRTELVCTD